MARDTTLADLASAARRAIPRPIGCPCGGTIVLGGAPAPTYTCASCGTVAHDLTRLVPTERR